MHQSSHALPVTVRRTLGGLHCGDSAKGGPRLLLDDSRVDPPMSRMVVAFTRNEHAGEGCFVHRIYGAQISAKSLHQERL